MAVGATGLFCLFLSVSCALAGDRIYGGRVLDYETKAPIEGAVVVAYWVERMAHPAGRDTRLKEVKEILTDRDGKWSITGPEEEIGDPHVSFLTSTYYIQHPRFIVFKPGYCSWPNGFALDACREKMKPGGAGKIAEGENVELPRLKEKEDRLKTHRIGPIYDSYDGKKEEDFLRKQRSFIRLLNQEKRYLGLEVYKYGFLEE